MQQLRYDNINGEDHWFESSASDRVMDQLDVDFLMEIVLLTSGGTSVKCLTHLTLLTLTSLFLGDEIIFFLEHQRR